MSTATKGRAFEHHIKHLLEADGFSVMRGAGSKGEVDMGEGPEKVDLIATKTTRDNEYKAYIQFTVAVQCKVRGL
jgi:Holliday junction resolvase